MTKEEAINSFKKSNEQTKLNIQVHRHIMDTSEIRELEWYIERDKMAIEALEQEPKTEWIPVSERLPEKGGEYLCCYGKRIHIGQMINGHFRHYGEVADHLIVAWMPLPEPYRRKIRIESEG